MGARFEVVSKHAGNGINKLLPKRKTKYSAGYDFRVAKDTLIPPHLVELEALSSMVENKLIIDYNELCELTKKYNVRPTLIPTGVKCKLDPNTYLEISVRSSTPLKSGIILANGVGIIDADYYNNPDNEGEIFFQVINLTPFNIILKAGETIGQGIIKPYLLTEDDEASGARTGGFGSTDG
jgi:dUTP pyrophosphatase